MQFGEIYASKCSVTDLCGVALKIKNTHSEPWTGVGVFDQNKVILSNVFCEILWERVPCVA